MILKILLIVFVLLTFQSCSFCEREVLVDVPVPYAVPISCAVPDVNCSVSGNDTEVVINLLECIVEYKRSGEVCK